MSKNPANPANIVARQKARELLAAGVSVPAVAAAVGKNKNTIYLWMKQPLFAEKLRVEIKRAMSGTRRGLGHIARRAVASADQSLQQLENTRDNPRETTAARDRAANRLLGHAHKWGLVIDRDLDSGEACGSSTFGTDEYVDYPRENEQLIYELHRAVEIMSHLEQNLMRAGVPVEENIPGLVQWMGFEKYCNYLDKEYIEKSALFKHAQAVDKPEPTELDKKDAARRAAYRAAELAGEPPPHFEEDDEDVEDGATGCGRRQPVRKQNEGAESSPGTGCKQPQPVAPAAPAPKSDEAISAAASAESPQNPALTAAPATATARKADRKKKKPENPEPEKSPPPNPMDPLDPTFDPMAALHAAIARSPETRRQQEELLRKQAQQPPRISIW